MGRGPTRPCPGLALGAAGIVSRQQGADLRVKAGRKLREEWFASHGKGDI